MPVFKEVIGTNVTGAMFGSVVAFKGMLEQGSGGIYNMEGLGSSGPIIRGMALYGTTKSALAYLTRAMAKEAEGTPILVGGLRPGMVATKLITGQYEGHPEDWERSKHIFNILSDKMETVTPWLAKRILANKKNGVYINWLTRWKIMRRFMLAPVHKRKIFD
jgi:NAD(P)-dependent dehydrogenase (short-subunit alcohol dehydrogenase family)